MVVVITSKTVDSEKTSRTTGLGTNGLGSTETTRLDTARTVLECSDISGVSATLDARLVHKMDPVAGMGLAGEFHGGPSSTVIHLGCSVKHCEHGKPGRAGSMCKVFSTMHNMDFS